MSKESKVESQEFGYGCTFDGCDLTFPNDTQLIEHVRSKHATSISTPLVSLDSTNQSILLTPIKNLDASTSNELMEKIRKINPFDLKFREANNKALKHTESYSQILSFLNSSNVSFGSVDSFDANAMITTMSDIGLGGLSDLPNLSLKLPETSSLLSGIGLDTPEITNLVSQVVRDDATAKSAPQTADVLKAVLDLRETVELQEAEKRKKVSDQHDKFPLSHSFSDEKLIDSDVRSNLAGSPPALNPFDIIGQERFVQQIPLQLPSTPATTEVSTDGPGENPVYISLKINDQVVRIPIQIGFVNGNNKTAPAASSAPISVENFVTTATGTILNTSQFLPPPAATSLLPSSSSSSSSLSSSSASVIRSPLPNVVSVKTVRPVPIAAAQPTIPATTPIKIIRSTLPTISKVTTVAPQQPQPAANQTTYYQPILLSSSLQQDLEETMKSLQPTPNRFPMEETSPRPDHMYADSEEMKKKETLERNKQAAWRYRKRKKEEMGVLAEKVKILESEKLELKTQVHVLKIELARVNKILDQHKSCMKLGTSSRSVFDEENELRPMNAENVILSATSNHLHQSDVDDAGRMSDLSLVTAAANSTGANLVRYVALPVNAMSPTIDEAGTATGVTTATDGANASQLLLQPLILSNGTVVLPSNHPQLPYIVPLVKRSTSAEHGGGSSDE